jgi:hypothetical protein
MSLNIIALGEEMFANHARSLVMGLAKKPVRREASERAVDEQPAHNLVVVSTTREAAQTYVLNILHASKIPSNIDCVGVQQDARLRGRTRNGFMLFLPDLQLVAGHHLTGLIENYEIVAQGTRCPNNLHLVMPLDLQNQFLMAHFDRWACSQAMVVTGYGPLEDYGTDECVIGMTEANFLLNNTHVKVEGDTRQVVRFAGELERLNGDYLTRLFRILHHSGRPLLVPLDVAKIMYSYQMTPHVECPIELAGSKPVNAQETRIVSTHNISFYANNGLDGLPGNPSKSKVPASLQTLAANHPVAKPTTKKPAAKPAAKKPAQPRKPAIKAK